jgi:hypothetical protein
VTKPSAAMTYASVVSRESVRIAFTIAALNDLDCMTADIQNAYLNAPVTEKVWTWCDPEFGPEHNGKKAIIVRALYGLKSSGAAFRQHLALCMADLEYESCLADPDVWMRKTTRANKSEYYEYMLIYTDDLLAISENPKVVLKQVDKYFPMKPESVGKPDIYLGAKVTSVKLPNEVDALGLSPTKYVTEAIKNVEHYLTEHSLKLPNRAGTPLSSGYRPEMDVSPELDPEKANYYQSLIGILRWAVEI